MERNIVHWSYWLGIASLVIALGWRGFNALGLWLYKASLLFFVTAIASANYAFFRSKRP